MSLRAAVPAIFVVGLIVLFVRGLNMDPTRIPSPFIGKPAPEFDLEDLREPGKRVRLTDLVGAPFALNVWGTWSVGCRQEHTTLMRIRRDGRVPLVGMNWRDEREAALAYLARDGDPFVAVGSDIDGAAAIDWGVYGAPETFLVDASGTVVYKHIGPLDYDTWQREFLERVDAMEGR